MIKKIVVIVTSIILVIILAFTAKNISSNYVMNKKIKAVDSYLKETAKGYGFNGTVLIAKDGKILLNKGYGYADFKNKIRNTSDTEFSIGSITKSITATAIMQLVEKGKLKLTDTLNKYIPDYPRGKEITIKELLTHSSGIQDYMNDDIMTEKNLLHIAFKPITPVGLIRLFENKSLNFKPGSNYRYSNSGYILLGYIIEKVSGKSYGEYIKENVFNKAGMSTANYAPLEKIKKMAKPTDVNIYKEQVLKPLPFANYTMGFSGGGICCTANDLYKFDMDLRSENSKLLSKESINELFKGQIKIGSSTKYCYGWFVASNGILYHSGRTYGYNSFNTIIPKDKTVIILLENIDPPVMDINNVNSDIINILSNKK